MRADLASFGFSIDTDIRPIRAIVIALNEMMNHSDVSEPDVHDAFGFLIVDLYARLDRILETHEAVLEKTRAVEPDALRVLIERFAAAKADIDHRVSDEREGDDEVQKAHEGKVMPLWRQLCEAPPPATSAAGAVAALRLALDEQEIGPGPLEGVMIRSAIAFLEGRSS